MFGLGMEGVLRSRAKDLRGIVNGVDYSIWNPETDELIPANYSADDLDGKQECKRALQEEFGLPQRDEVPVIGMIGRLVHQKGVDIVLDAMHELMELPVQIVLLGSGDIEYQVTLQKLEQQYPDKLAVRIGYNEGLAHQIEAGADVFLMPSRFEPCGLNQMYSMRYGTPPVVRSVGGLADTVTDTNATNLAAKTATGFVFSGDKGSDLYQTLARACEIYRDKSQWKTIQLAGMGQDFSWQNSAQEYLKLYNAAIREIPAA